jgi:glycosyltransferase involved in cell wall biosynthesis
VTAPDEPRPGGDGRPPRVAVLWTRLSGYFHASLKALADRGVDVLVVHQQGEADAPFDLAAVTSGIRAEQWSDAPDPAVLDRLLDEHDPDALLVSSWNVGPYRRAARARRGRTVRLFGMDNQWWSTPKQWAGVLTARWNLRPTYDGVFVCGDRQADFAARLGFPAERLVWGMAVGDHARFAEVARARGDALPPPAFLYVGRLAPEKGIDVLAAAYQRYRSQVDDPWSLVIAGRGAEEAHLAGADGVKLLGFVQPADLPSVFADAGCLVLPSRFEPWAVVVHEAAAAGLPVICTRVSGASTRLVLDGYNGVAISAGDVGALTGALLRIHRASDGERRAMGAASEALALQYSPEQWAARLMTRIPEIRELVGLPPTPWRPA